MKSKGIRRLMGLVLAGIMTTGLLTGCGKNGSGENTDNPTGSANPTVTKAAQGDQKTPSDSNVDRFDPAATASSNGITLPELPNNTLKLEVSIAEYQQSSEGTQIQKLWQEKMEAYLGCKLDITFTRTPSVDYASNELVVLQSGRLPDIATATKGKAATEYGEDGTLLNIADYMDYMVYYPDYMAGTNGGADFAKNEDGSMYYFMDGFYNMDNIQGAQSFTAFAYRFDVLRDFGWEPATTLDEFTQLCADIQSKIDDGSLNAEYVMINNTKDNSLYRGFMGIFHAWDCLYYNGSEWVYGPAEDNFREMLKYMNSLYEAGYIDPEFATADFNQGQVKATTNVGVICPTLWAGSAAGWNSAKIDENMEWGLAYFPEHPDHGTPWKWGSRQGGKSLAANMGIYISTATKYPEYVVAMIDYQYSDQMVELMNWGIEGSTYQKAGNDNSFSDEIMNAEKPAIAVAEYGIMSSSVCRSGIVFNPLDFKAMLEVSSLPEPWWNESKGYYEGKYWVETSANGGEGSVAPYDRPPVTYLTAEEQTAKTQLEYGGVCGARVREITHRFIVGELDVHDDAEWEKYIKDVKSQTEEDFDGIIKMLNEKTVK